MIQRNLTEDQLDDLMSRVASIRHTMHCMNTDSEEDKSRYVGWCGDIAEYTGLNLMMSHWDDLVYCDSDDCLIEDCEYCDEIEDRMFIDAKDENNDLIEEWMRAMDEYYDTEYAPSGVARMRWIERNL